MTLNLPQSLRLLFILSCFAQLSFAQSPADETISLVTHTPVRSASPKAHPPIRNFEHFAVYWTDEPGWHSELQLRNNLIGQDLIVTPALRMADGTELSLSPVTIKPSDVVSVDLHSAALAADPKHLPGYGSAVLRFRSTVIRALYAAVMVHDVGHPIAFHMDAFPGYATLRPFATGSHEGIWWLPNGSVTDYLVLTNSAAHSVDSVVTIYDASGVPVRQPITLGARQTRRLSVRSLLQQGNLTGNYGGIEVGTAQGAGFIDIAHFVFDEVAGFGAIMKTFERHPDSKFEERSWGGVKQWTIRAPMLALTSPDPALALPSGAKLEPKVFVRNASAKSYTADIRFNWYSGSSSGKTAPMPIPLQAHETKLIDVAALQAQKTIPSDASWSSVLISAPIQPEELVAVAASFDKTLHYGTQTPFNDQLAAHWEGGKWEVDAAHDSIVTAGNGGNKPIQAQVTLFYNNGLSKYQVEQTLAPDEQLWLDFGKLIRNQVPDKNGKVLPANLTSGSYQFRDLTDSAVGNIFEGKVITDKTYGNAAYGCMNCCDYPDGGFMWTDPLGVPISDFRRQDVGAVNSCTGNTDPIGRFYSTWWTQDTSIATANPALQINGIAAGNTLDFASGNINMSSLPRSCPLYRNAPQGGVSTGKQVDLIGTNCNASTITSYTGNWGDLNNLAGCALTEPDPIPSGGSCVAGSTTPKGTPKTCYQFTSSTGCQTTYCAVNTRVVDSACTKFIDQGGFTQTAYPAGCQ